MARFRAKYYREDIDGCDFIIQKKCLFFWRWYDPLLYTKDEALERLKEIEENYPNVRPAGILKEIEI
jgi:hypothetical protein